jgi:hypothetical protein
MNLVGRIARGGMVAALFGILAWPPNNAARGQQAASAPPAATAPLLHPDLFKLPYAAPNYELDKRNLGRLGDDTPGFALPDSIDLGKYMLRLDTSHNVVDFVPRAQNDAPDLSDIIVPAHGGKKHKRMQNYFGLTLTAPTH